MPKRVLYLTRNGLLEPLGQSQVLAYLRPLSELYKIHIISFEKPKDLQDKAYVSEIRSICAAHNISWTPLTYRKGIRQLSILLGFWSLIRQAVSICRREGIELIHARSYFPAFIALYIHWRYHIPFIFDMRALWPEELISAGRLAKGSVAHRLIKELEKKCLKEAAAVVSLTRAAVYHLDQVYPSLGLPKKTSVIPTCTDLDRFSIDGKVRPGEADLVIISCVGTLLSGWFKMDMLKMVFRHFMRHYPLVEFEIITRDDHIAIRQHLDPDNQFSNRLRIEEVAFQEVPNKLKTQHGSIFFFNADTSKLGSCPTRMGELLAAGIPLLANPGVGDVGQIVEQEKVGILLRNSEQEAVSDACNKFIDLLKEENIAAKCRQSAESLFSLSSGAAMYQEIYSCLLKEKKPSPLE